MGLLSKFTPTPGQVQVTHRYHCVQKVKNLDNLYGQIQREHQISPGDFPDLKTMQERLQHHDFTKFKALDARLLNKVSVLKFLHSFHL